MTWFWDILVGFVMPPTTAYAWLLVLRACGIRPLFFLMWVSSAAVPMVMNLASRDWGLAACEGASLALALVLWWYRRRRRDRAPKLSSAKGRAIIAALVRRAREAAKPHPVLRPVPGGAR